MNSFIKKHSFVKNYTYFLLNYFGLKIKFAEIFFLFVNKYNLRKKKFN